ncbi:hypothetical protein Ae201684P_017747 [Aphanomyces euteiches]|uniref:Uncharacterized protein n=1 Tax=Aphanomyces euteiches TaxID=100861 RepID=A0A6G0XM16_9STRA|nr:hypothetical protein Ae201684_003187 [Aphanomyces euteiches]KAH9098535.1 hypothetical protein Ae201684P_017747 [Aphanomyces euteiches]KAH9143401.1 hypothetical protein AeRB84_012624 [Aphanomyces euteiches]
MGVLFASVDITETPIEHGPSVCWAASPSSRDRPAALLVANPTPPMAHTLAVQNRLVHASFSRTFGSFSMMVALGRVGQCLVGAFVKHTRRRHDIRLKYTNASGRTSSSSLKLTKMDDQNGLKLFKLYR